jgi:PqqD family protein of HPr-rel-A system
MKWIAHKGDLIWRTWDDHQPVVYHVPSGATHLLNRVSALALRQLEDRSLSPAELTSLLAESLDCDADEELLAYVERLVAGFDERGLVEPTS